MIRPAITALLLSPLIAFSQSPEALREKYLASPKTSDAVKAAIKKSVVVVGMCPFEVFASAGLPGPYMVRRDERKWSSNTPPPEIISAQCESPDESTIELMFKNKSQFNTKEPVVFRVRFVHGKSVLVDQKGFNEK